jgi:hypothetical protein
MCGEGVTEESQRRAEEEDCCPLNERPSVTFSYERKEESKPEALGTRQVACVEFRIWTAEEADE